MSSYSPVPALLSCLFIATLSSCSPIVVLSSYFPISTLLSYFFIPALLSCFPMATLSSSSLIPASSSHLLMTTLSFSSILILSSLLILALISCSILDPALTYLISLVVKRFKLVLSDKSLCCCSTSPNLIEPFYPFPTLVLLFEKNNCKQLFDMVFINSHSLNGNYTAKELDLSFREYKYSIPIKLNRL